MSGTTAVGDTPRFGELVPLNDLGRNTYLMGIIESVVAVGWYGWRFKFLMRTAADLPLEWLVNARLVVQIDGQYRFCQISARSYHKQNRFVAFAEVGQVVPPEELDDDMKSLGAVTVMVGSETCVFLAA